MDLVTLLAPVVSPHVLVFPGDFNVTAIGDDILIATPNVTCPVILVPRSSFDMDELLTSLTQRD